MLARRLVPGKFPNRPQPAEAFPAVRAAGRWRGLRIGLLGGSFNPAHGGHVYISLEALKRLRIDWIWWLVAPQNPLKSGQDMAPLETRLAAARRVARHPRIRVTALERRLGTRYTADTLARLRAAVPGARFVWIMGADNLATFTHWQRWRAIIESVPLAIIDRDHYSLRGLTGKVATRYRHCRMSVGALAAFARVPTPAWTFITLRRHPASATEIREGRQHAASAPDSAAVNVKE